MTDKKDNYIGFRAWDMGFAAHLTVLYTGLMDEETRYLADTILYEQGKVTAYCKRLSLDLFGPRKDVPVLRVEVHKSLYELRDHLIDSGLPNPSQFSDVWHPHISIKMDDPGTINLPYVIRLDEFGVH